MRLALLLSIALAGCAAKKSAVKNVAPPANAEHSAPPAAAAAPDAAPPHEPDKKSKSKASSDPCEGGE